MVIHGTRPTSTVHDKYDPWYDRVGSPLSAGKCASIGRALADALLVLRPLGARVCLLMCLHVHCGNIFLAGDDERPQLAEWEQGLLGLPPHLSDFVNDLKRALEPAAASLALCLYEMACAFKARRPPRRLPAQLPVRRQRDARSDAPHADTKGAEAATYARGRARARALHASRRARAQGAETRANTSAWPPPLSEALLEHAQQVSSAFRSYDYLLLDRDPNPIPESPRMYESPRAAPRKRSENRESLTL